jgi:predicted esterase
LGTACIFLIAAAVARADEHPMRKPGADAVGQVYTWKAKDGLAYEYFVPKSYDAKAGANLTVVLHGSNLDRRWTFLNHPPGKFRPADVVVSPDGTTPNKEGTGFNFLDDPKDLERVHALLDDLRATFTVKETFLYGHSQGSFFTFLYAGAYPKDVDGICAASSGAWTNSKIGPAGHHQAIGILHGTQDPVVPYGQSRGAFDLYRKSSYPLVHLRTLHGWGHPPEAIQAGFVLAWCEGTTTSSPARARAALDELAAGCDGFGDYAALYAVACRLSGRGGRPLADVSAADKGAAESIAKAIESLAAAHAEAVRAAIPKGGEIGPWASHLVQFLDGFDGVPARDALAADERELLARHEKEADKRLRAFYQKRDRAPADAFDEGVAAVKGAFLDPNVPGILETLAGLEKNAKASKIGKPALAAYEKTVPTFEKSQEAGTKAFTDLNRKEGRMRARAGG